MFKNMKLKKKLVIYFLLVGIIPFLTISLISTFQAMNALEANAFNQLKAVQSIKENQIKSFFDERVEDAKIFSELPFLSQAISELYTIGEEAESNGFKEKRLLEYPSESHLINCKKKKRKQTKNAHHFSH